MLLLYNFLYKKGFEPARVYKSLLHFVGKRCIIKRLKTTKHLED